MYSWWKPLPSTYAEVSGSSIFCKALGVVLTAKSLIEEDSKLLHKGTICRSCNGHGTQYWENCPKSSFMLIKHIPMCYTKISYLPHNLTRLCFYKLSVYTHINQCDYIYNIHVSLETDYSTHCKIIHIAPYMGSTENTKQHKTYFLQTRLVTDSYFRKCLGVSQIIVKLIWNCL